MSKFHFYPNLRAQNFDFSSNFIIDWFHVKSEIEAVKHEIHTLCYILKNRFHVIFFPFCSICAFWRKNSKMALMKVKGNLERLFDKNLNDLVRGIRNHKDDESKYIAGNYLSLFEPIFEPIWTHLSPNLHFFSFFSMFGRN